MNKIEIIRKIHDYSYKIGRVDKTIKVFDLKKTVLNFIYSNKCYGFVRLITMNYYDLQYLYEKLLRVMDNRLSTIEFNGICIDFDDYWLDVFN